MRTALRWTGEILITLGVVLLLFVVYEVWWTTLVADRASNRNVTAIQEAWSAPDPKPAPAAPPEVTEQPPMGTPFALMTIPRLGDNMNNKPVLQGATLDQLAQGMGHYPESAMPGQVGNFAVAGHRITLGEPMRYVDTLQVGDNVYVETKTYWYHYRLTKTQIVDPSAVWTVSPDPFGSGGEHRLITLTTCEPLWGNSSRWIWWGELVGKQPKTQGTPTMVVNG